MSLRTRLIRLASTLPPGRDRAAVLRVLAAGQRGDWIIVPGSASAHHFSGDMVEFELTTRNKVTGETKYLSETARSPRGTEIIESEIEVPTYPRSGGPEIQVRIVVDYESHERDYRTFEMRLAINPMTGDWVSSRMKWDSPDLI